VTLINGTGASRQVKVLGSLAKGARDAAYQKGAKGAGARLKCLTSLSEPSRKHF